LVEKEKLSEKEFQQMNDLWEKTGGVDGMEEKKMRSELDHYIANNDLKEALRIAEKLETKIGGASAVKDRAWLLFSARK